MRAWALGFFWILLLGVGACAPFGGGAFECTDDTQCDQSEDGRCELSGFCSYADGACSSGRRYGDFSSGLSQICVGEEPDASILPDADPGAPDADLNAPDAAPVTPTTLTFQHGANGYNGGVDTFVNEAAPGTTHGAIADFEWDAEPGAATVGLLRFDNILGAAVTQIPPNATIASATLRIVVNAESSGAPGDIHIATSNWNEATTWNTLGATVGVQAEDLGAIIAPAPVPIGTFDIDVTSSVQGWANAPVTNLGWAFNPNSIDGAHVVSKEGAQAERPQLSVTFTP
jgi:hypothetical protein